MSICNVKQTLVLVWLEVLTGENRAVSSVLQSVDLLEDVSVSIKNKVSSKLT